MFCVLSLRKRNRNAFEKIFGRLMTDEYIVNTIPVYRGAPFFTLEIITGKSEIDWENVIMSVGRCSSRLLADDDIFIPEDSCVSRFKSNILYGKMMENTFLNILKSNFCFDSIFIRDSKGENAAFIKKAAVYASQLSLATKNTKFFSSLCDDIIGLTGMCPVIKNEYDNDKIEIDTDEWSMIIHNTDEKINITDGVDFTMPEIYEGLLPERIERYDFCSALYELCGVFSMGALLFDTIIVNNEKKRAEDVHFS